MSVLQFWGVMAATWVLVAIAAVAVCYLLWHPDSFEKEEPR